MPTIHTINSKFGSIEISAPVQKTLIAKPSGYISPKMIIQDLEFVENYNKTGFDYYVDLRGSVFPHPINLLYIRKLHKIPNLKTYTIVTDNFIQTIIFGLLKYFVKYTEIIGTAEFENRLKP